MLENSFIHIKGLGPDGERELWEQGCHSWQDLLADVDSLDCPKLEKKKLVSSVKRSIKARESGEHQFFRRGLGPNQSWRAFSDFRSSCVYLDIETDGGNRGSSITTIGLYDGKTFRCLVRDEDLGNFPDIISEYSMVVTFFGTGFDLPVLRKRFPLIRFDHIHLDLCPALRELGHSGGLKKIEKELGISRSLETDGLTGFDAAKLWRKYIRLRDESALETLIAYNREDVVNLEKLADYAYTALWSQTYRPGPKRNSLFAAC